MFSHCSILRCNTPKPTQAGFGLIELLVSISVLVIVTSVILVRQTSFDGAVLLRSQAYEVALQLRDIQLSAVSASYDTADFRSTLGAHFTTNTSRYSIFRDSASGADDNNYYDVGEEFGQQGILDRRFEIREIRVIDSTPSTETELSIVFQRPNFDARFFTAGNTEVTAGSVEIEVARVGDTATRTVEVTSAGQISVQ
jgi:prepilin-type N-terminal cleavage/methylation domain-containing protein